MIFKFDRACTCCRNERVYAPHTEREETPERLIEHLSIDDRQAFEAAMESYYRDSALHEAGHVVAAAATGRKTLYATLGGGTPHVHYRKHSETPSVLDLLIATTAGVVAERLGNGETFGPLWSNLCELIRRARGGDAGTCDGCHVARTMTAYFPDCADEVLVESWFGVIDCAHALLADKEVCAAHAALAQELHEATLVEQERIEEIVAAFDLANAMDRALGPLNLSEILPAWRLELA